MEGYTFSGEIGLPGGGEIGLHPLRAGVEKSTPPPGCRNRSIPLRAGEIDQPPFGVDNLVYPLQAEEFGLPSSEVENLIHPLSQWCKILSTPRVLENLVYPPPLRDYPPFLLEKLLYPPVGPR